MKTSLFSSLFLLMCFAGFSAKSQGRITGTVTTSQNSPLIGATVAIKSLRVGTVTDANGHYSMNVANGTYTVMASFVGFETITKSVTVTNAEAKVEFNLNEDALNMSEVVVTGTFDRRTKLESSVAITTLNAKGIEQRSGRGTGDFLQAVPGTFIDNSAGEVENRVYARGLSSGRGGNGTGFRYVMLMEDGMPITSTLTGYAAPDILHRADLTVGRFEGVRGGSASIATANSPGGMYNFISKEGGLVFGGDAKLQYGIHNNGNHISRFDLNVGGPISKGWTYNVGGFYRVDQGARTIPFNANEGGQLKANLVRNTAKGKIKLYGKILNDRNIVWRNIPIDDLTNPTALYGFDKNNSSTITQMSNVLPDGGLFATDKTATRDWNSQNGIKVKTQSLGLEFTRELSTNVTLVNNARYTHFDVRYNQITGEQVLPVSSFNGFGGVTMNAVQTGEELYNQATSVNSLGNFIMLTAPLDMRNSTNDFSDLLTVNIKANKHSLTVGGYYGTSKIDIKWDADLIAQAIEPNARLLNITANNPYKAATGGAPARLNLTDANGWYSYGSIALTRFNDKATTTALFANDVWQATNKLSIDAAMRYESVNHTGQKQYWGTPALGTLAVPASLATVNQIGADGQYGTRYDATMRIANGKANDFDHTNAYFSYSVGANYKISERAAVFGRYTNGHKAPDTDFYVQNYTNVPVLKGVTEDISMAEVGYKINAKHLALSLTGFMSILDNLPYTQLITNTVTGESFFTPATFNTSKTTGLEFEGNIKAGKIVSLVVIGTLQNPKFTNFSFYNVNGFQHPVYVGQTYPAVNPSSGTPYLFPDNRLNPSSPQGTPNATIAAGTPSYHTIEDLSGKKVDEIPSVILDVTPAFQLGKAVNVYLNWRYTGERQYNKQNAFTMPAYSVINAGATFTFKKIELGTKVTNLTNNATLILNDGLGRPTAPNIDAIKPIDIAAQKTAGYPFWGRPMLARLVMFSVSYKF